MANAAKAPSAIERAPIFMIGFTLPKHARVSIDFRRVVARRDGPGWLQVLAAVRSLPIASGRPAGVARSFT